MNFLKVPESCIKFDTPDRQQSYKENFDVYDEDTILGRGAYGVVLRGTYKKKKVAVKILDKSNTVKYNSLRQEANILNVQHKNIMKIIKIVEGKTYGAVIMEGLEGKCLQTVLDHHRVDLIHRLHILSDIASAIKFCHQNGIVHFDLKPQNVFVAVNAAEDDSEGRMYTCKLFDFGCSMRINCPQEYFGGTARYCAPEVLQNSPADYSADIFSLAVIMWQLKENKIPYGSIDSNDIIIYNVVRNNLRPDNITTCSEFKMVKSEFSKSESSFIQVQKFINSPLTPKSYNRNIEKVPDVLITKPLRMLEKSSYGSHQKNRIFKNRKSPLIRKNLFESTLSPKQEGDDCPEVHMQELFVDSKLYMRSPESILRCESEYIKMYKTCWKSDKNQRYDAGRVLDVIQQLIKSL